MSKETGIIVGALAGALGLGGCQFAERYGEQRQTADLPDTTAQSLWQHLEAQDYRRQWDFWPGKQALYTGTHPHGALLTTYVNPLALDALTSGARQMPPGAIIVKENYAPSRALAAVTVMYKAKAGYNPEHNDWFWLKRLADGTVESSGKVAGCQACHASSPRDYLLTPLPN